ncbi:MAG: division/cell wall cluster transcriptional repressor MraZ [Bdellovibrionota bacterium]
MFIGSQFEHVLDAKGRTSIPAKFREVLLSKYDERLILTPDRPGCVRAHPFLVWTQRLEKFRVLPKTHPAVRAFERVVLGQAQEVSIDKQGRILVPPQLRARAGLKKQILFEGLDDTFMIWDAKSWEAALTEDQEFLSNNPTALSDLGL